MALGTNRARNWGKEAQQIALDLALMRRHVAYKTTKPLRQPSDGRRHLTLWLTGSRDGVTLPYTESCADLVNVRRGRWEARHHFDGRVLATGISERDVIPATIEAIWH